MIGSKIKARRKRVEPHTRRIGKHDRIHNEVYNQQNRARD